MVAMVIHFMTSILFAVVVAFIIRDVTVGLAIGIGIVAVLLLYGFVFYVMTAGPWPWFENGRNWVNIIGGVALMLMADASRMIGLIDANLSRHQGCMVLGRSNGVAPLVAGVAMHLAMGSVLALGYALAFSLVWGEASWVAGALLGAAHGVVAGAGFPLLDASNPCVREGRMRGFGLMGRGHGVCMTLGLLAGT